MCTQVNLYIICFAFEQAVPMSKRLILADAQTSGGLLVSVRAAEAEGLLAKLRGTPGCEASAIVGKIVAREAGAASVKVFA